MSLLSINILLLILFSANNNIFYESREYEKTHFCGRNVGITYVLHMVQYVMDITHVIHCLY